MSFVSRRELIRAAIAAGVLRATRAEALTPPTRPTNRSADKLILGAPLTHSDWMLKPGIEWGPAGVRHMLDTCKACGWTQVYWRALDGGRSMYPSKLLHAGDKWDDDSFWSPKDPHDRALAEKIIGNVPQQKRQEILAKMARLDYSLFDALGEAVRYGHQIGLAIHAWVSINEGDHGWGLTSDFARAHPEFHWRRRDGSSYHSQLSFAFEEVRKYKLAILDEILSGYAVDGIFLDWIRTGDVRDNPQTDPQGVANSGYEQPLIDQFKRQFGIDPHGVENGDARWCKRVLSRKPFLCARHGG